MGFYSLISLSKSLSLSLKMNPAYITKYGTVTSLHILWVLHGSCVNNHLSEKTGLVVMQSHPLHSMHFSEYQAMNKRYELHRNIILD